MRPRFLTFSLALSAAVAISACGSGSQPSVVKTSNRPTGADDLIFRVDSRGGFTTAEYQIGIVPLVSVYGDGRVIVGGPVTEQYPPHALPNLLTGTLSTEQIQALAARAERDGLLRMLDFGQPGISDAPTTEVTINLTGTPVRQGAYALDFGASDSGMPGVDAAQIAARAKLSRFVGALSDAATQVATAPYVASEVAVHVRPERVEDTQGDSGVTPGTANWPLGDLGVFGTPPAGDLTPEALFNCEVLSGTDASAALAAAKDASAITRWISAGARYIVVFRPLMPDEHTCP